MLLAVRVFPALAFPFALYLFFLMTGGGAGLDSGHAPFVHIPTPSHGSVGINAADVIALVVVLCLSIDLGSAASTATTSIVHLTIDVLLGIVCLVLFLMVPGFATSSFLVLTAAAMLEFIVGAGITTISARRDVSYGTNN